MHKSFLLWDVEHHGNGFSLKSVQVILGLFGHFFRSEGRITGFSLYLWKVGIHFFRKSRINETFLLAFCRHAIIPSNVHWLVATEPPG